MTTHSPGMRRPYGYAILLAGIWIAAATIRPETTYHLAPPLVAGSVPLLRVLDATRQGSPLAVKWALGGIGMALGSTAVLAAFGNLDGPSLLPFGGAVTESVIFSLVGAVGGLAAALMSLRR